MKKKLIEGLIGILIVVSLFATYSVWFADSAPKSELKVRTKAVITQKNIGNNDAANKDNKTTHDRSKKDQEGTFTGRIVAMTKIDANTKAVSPDAPDPSLYVGSHEFLIETNTSAHKMIAIIQKDNWGLKPGDRVVLVTIKGTTYIKSKYSKGENK